MKKLLLFLLIVSMVSFSACTADADTNDTTDDIEDGTDDMDDTNTTDTDEDMTNDNEMESDVTAQIAGIDDNLRTSIEELNGPDATDSSDMDYMARSTQFSNRAGVYQLALDELNALDLDDENMAHYDALKQYYQEGYDTNTYLASQYTTFETSEDEQSFLDEMGEDITNIGTDIEQGYNDALEALGLR